MKTKQPTAAEKRNTAVYSYVRFSTPEQCKGTGGRRQTSAADQWCSDNGYSLARNYSDLGVSGFKSRNSTHGDLARFLALVHQGRISPGSILLVESL